MTRKAKYPCTACGIETYPMWPEDSDWEMEDYHLRSWCYSCAAEVLSDWKPDEDPAEPEE